MKKLATGGVNHTEVKMRNTSPLSTIPNVVAKHRREISIPRPPVMLADAVAGARKYYSTAVDLLNAELDRVRRAHEKGHVAWFGTPPGQPDPETFTSFDRVLWMGASCVMILECICAAVLASMTLAVPTALAVLVGIVLTAVFTLTMKAVWHLYVAPDEGQPRRALATLSRWLMPLFVAWAAALVAVLLLPRLVDESTPALNLWFNIVMSLLTVLSPALSGLLFAAATLYGWARSLTRQYYQVLMLRADVEAALEECERVSQRAGAPPVDISKRRGLESNRQTGTPIAGVLLLIGLLVATRGHAQARGEFWFDDSGSPRHEQLASAEDQFFKVLPAMIGASGVRAWDLFRFSRDAANARPVAAIDVGSFVEPPCAAPARGDELTRLFRRPQIAVERDSAKKCAQIQADIRAAYERDLSTKVAGTRLTFDAAPRARGVCTALLDLLNRVRDEPPSEAPVLVVIVSDGIESCIARGPVVLASPKSSVRAIMVITPSLTAGGLSPWKEFELRREWWGRAVPWLEVLPTSRLTSVLLTAGKDPRVNAKQ